MLIRKADRLAQFGYDVFPSITHFWDSLESNSVVSGSKYAEGSVGRFAPAIAYLGFPPPRTSVWVLLSRRQGLEVSLFQPFRNFDREERNRSHGETRPDAAAGRLRGSDLG